MVIIIIPNILCPVVRFSFPFLVVYLGLICRAILGEKLFPTSHPLNPTVDPSGSTFSRHCVPGFKDALPGFSGAQLFDLI